MAKRLPLLVMGALLAASLASDEHEFNRDCEAYLSAMRANYQAIKSRKADYSAKGIEFIRRNRETIEEDLERAFDECGATPRGLGFTREEYLRELYILIRTTDI